MGRYYLADIDDTEKRGRVRRFSSENEAKKWAKEELSSNQESSGPCHIFEVNDRTDRTELVSVVRRSSGKVETHTPRGSEKKVF